MDKKAVDQILASLRSLLPPDPRHEIEKNLRAGLQGVLDRLDLVTREELDVQEAVLQRTRARLQELEKRLVDLEEKLLKQK